MASYLLAHDLGTSGNKATLFSTDGKLIRSVTRSYGLYTAPGGIAEQNPEDWWNAVCESTKELTSDLPRGSVAAVSFSGQMMGCVCVDRCGDPVRPAMIWADMRSTAEESVLRQTVGDAEFYRITGNRLSSSYSGTKLMWVKAHEPQNYARTYKMLNAKDFVIYKLCGAFVSEPSDASSTCLWNLEKSEWSEDLLRASGLDREKMPDVLPSSAVAGKVSAESSVLCGLPEGTPVICGGGDGVCAAVGSGAVKSGVANLCLGTSSWISYASKKPLIDSARKTFNFAHAVPGYTMPCGTMQCGGGSLSWAFRTFCTFLREMPDGKEKAAIYDRINSEVANIPVGANGLIFLPYLMGERSPRWDPKAKGTLVGLTVSHTPADIFRAVMEGVAMNLAVILDTYRSQNADIKELMLIGGGARNEAWRQILADVLGVRILLPDLLEEATSMGAAIIAGVGIGAFPDFDASNRFLHVKKAYEPSPDAAGKYAKMKEAFEITYESLAKTFDILYNSVS